MTSRSFSRRFASLLLALLLAAACAPKPEGHPNFASPQVDPIALGPLGWPLYVANTTSNSVSVVDPWLRKVIAEVPVGLEPVSLAVRPGGEELWVSNHVSDTVSVVDVRPWSPTAFSVIRTIQALDERGVSQFDEPVGIAFAGPDKAYVALSSRNDVAVIDATTYAVTGRIHIRSQEPRALEVRGDRLFVLPFESGNQSELSVCPAEPVPNPPQCTLLAQEVGDFVTQPNLPGRDIRIVTDPLAPDRDLYVFDTATDSEIDVVTGIGTLLYGLAVSHTGEVFVTHTDARNAINGNGGEDLVMLENRIFENRIARVDCGGAFCAAAEILPLEPPLPAQPDPAAALATPYGVALSRDDSTLVATAAGTSRLFTLDTATGQVLDVLDLGPPAGGQIPKGVVLQSDLLGRPFRAYVLNTLENTVAVVDARDPEDLALIDKIAVGQDPTPEEVRLGRIAFNNAFASDSNTFSCGSCHPDGNTDQLLWRIGGACFFGACAGHDEVRSTMPVRGLAGTIPLHWDGTLGDPIGGRNGATGPQGDEPPNCEAGDDHSCFRQLVDASLSGVMCNQDGGCAAGVSGLPGKLAEDERDHMASFLASVSYPPSRERSLDDVMTPSAVQGLSDFFVNHGGVGAFGGVSACGDMNSGCHALPLLTSTNGPVLQGFDAPTLRGLNDRFLQFSLGITGSREALEAAVVGGPIPFGGTVLQASPSPFPWNPEEGYEEQVAFGAAFAAFEGIYNVGPVEIFQMLQEMSTGFSGAAGRQVTLREDNASDAATLELLAALEAADAKGVVELGGPGRLIGPFGALGVPVHYAYDADLDRYLDASAEEQLTRSELLDLAAQGQLVITLTAGLGARYGRDAQPLLAPLSDENGTIGNPNLPLLPSQNPMLLRGKHVLADASLFVDGQRAEGSVECVLGVFDPACTSGAVLIRLDAPPATQGMHTVQVQNPSGPLSNELPVCVGGGRQDCL